MAVGGGGMVCGIDVGERGMLDRLPLLGAGELHHGRVGQRGRRAPEEPLVSPAVLAAEPEACSSIGPRTVPFHMETFPWLVVFPGLAITLVVSAFNMPGDALRDVLDPRLRQPRRASGVSSAAAITTPRMTRAPPHGVNCIGFNAPVSSCRP